MSVIADLFGGSQPTPQPAPILQAAPTPPPMPVPNDQAVAAAKKKQLAMGQASALNRRNSVINQQGTGGTGADTLA